jgi:hypothetical protein
VRVLRGGRQRGVDDGQERRGDDDEAAMGAEAVPAGESSRRRGSELARPGRTGVG